MDIKPRKKSTLGNAVLNYVILGRADFSIFVFLEILERGFDFKVALPRFLSLSFCLIKCRARTIVDYKARKTKRKTQD